MNVCACVSVQVSVPLCECPGTGGLGSPGGATAATAAQPGTCGCAGLERVPFCEIYRILPRKNRLEQASKPPCLPSPPHPLCGPSPAPSCQEPGSRDWYFPGRGLSHLWPREPLEPHAGQSRTEEAVDWLRSCKCWGWREATREELAVEVMAGVQQQEPEAKTLEGMA